MFQIYINNAVFAQAAKYMIIAKNDIETKRSEVCSLWTSAPTFHEPILIDSLDHLIIKSCIATTDRKLSVIGSFQIESNQLNGNQQVIYEKQRNFVQNIEDKQVCIGRCRIRILKAGMSGQQQNVGKEQMDFQDELQLRSQQSEDDENQQNYECQLVFLIHCGFDFYLNEGFRVSIKWGAQKKQTQTIYNKISPFWGEYIMLRGKETKFIQISVNDSKNSKLEWLKISPKSIRIMFPYHLNIRFRQECVNAYPSLYFSVLRQDVPLFSILDRQINLGIKHVGPPLSSRTHQYLLIYRREVEDDEKSRLPVFMSLDMKNYISFQNINELIQNNQNKDYEWNHWNLLLPINSKHSVKNPQQLSLLKSTFSKPLVCIYFTLDEAKLLFQNNLWNGVKIIERKQNFQNIVKNIYYNDKKCLLGKVIELSNIEAEGEQNDSEAVSDEGKWRILSQNYLIRKKILDKSDKNTLALKQSIRSKGQYLKQLKKILIEVRKMNTIMIQKQKSAFVPKQRKIKQNYNDYDLVQIISMLFTKYEELHQRKQINDEMRMRMNTLQHFNEDTEELNRAVLENSEKLLAQQKMIKDMENMRKALPKQQEILRRLEKIFEQRQIDKQMNDLLKKQHEKLNSIRKKKYNNLQNVYKIIKEKGSTQNSLLQAIDSAEKQLVALNTEYVKLTHDY